MPTITYPSECVEDDDGRIRVNESLFTGSIQERRPDGVIIRIYNYFEGLQEGVQLEWFGAGDPHKIEEMSGGQFYGLSVEYFPGGRLKFEAIKVYGVRMRFKVWNEVGELLQSAAPVPSAIDRQWVQRNMEHGRIGMPALAFADENVRHFFSKEYWQSSGQTS